MIEFSEWKARAAQILVRRYSDATDERERKDLDYLISLLKNLRYRELARFILDLHHYCRNFNRHEVCREILREEIAQGE